MTNITLSSLAKECVLQKQVNEFVQTINDQSCDEPKFCGPPIEDTQKCHKTESRESVRYKFKKYESAQTGDCEWNNLNVYVYANGDYTISYFLKDHGAIIGDIFHTTIQLLNEKKEPFSVNIQWDWKNTLKAHENMFFYHPGHNDEIKKVFEDIQYFHRQLKCSPDNPF